MIKDWKRKILSLLVTTGLTLSLITPVLAAEDEGLSFDLDQIVVTATKTEKKLRDVPASVDVITKEDIERMNIKTVDDALRNISGVAVKRSKGLMDSTNKVTMRGFGGQKYVLVLLDGQPLNDGYNQGVDWSSIPVENIEKIEVLKGPGSALYGSNAMGGVINIITKSTASQETQLKYLTGGLGTREQSISHSNKIGKLDYFFNAKSTNVDGYYSPETASKGKNGASEDEYDLKLVYDFDEKNKLTFRGSHSKYKYTYEKNTDNGNYKTDTLFLAYQANLGKDKDFSLKWSENKQDNNYLSSNALTVYPNKMAQLEAQFDCRLDEKNLLTLGFVNKDERGDSRTSKDEIGGMANTKSVYLQNERKLDDKLTFFLGGRYDSWTYSDGYYIYKSAPKQEIRYAEKSQSAFSPKVGLVYKADEKTTLKLSVAKGFRAPNTSEMFKDWYSTTNNIHYLGNSDLEPEKTTSYELGLDYQFDRSILGKISVFDTDVENMISTIYAGSEVYSGVTYTRQKPVNVGKGKIKGYEIDLTKQWNKNLKGFVNYTYTDAKMKEGPEAGQAVKYVPKDTLNIGIDYADGRWQGSLIGNYVGDAPNSSGQTGDGYKYYENYFILNTKVSYNLNENSKISLSVDNLLDQKYYQYDLAPGRIAYLELTQKF